MSNKQARQEAARQRASAALANLNHEVERICKLVPGVHFVATDQTSLRRLGDDALVSANEAGRFLMVNVKTLANWRSAGHGPRHLKIGGRVLYRAAELRAFLKGLDDSSFSKMGGAK